MLFFRAGAVVHVWSKHHVQWWECLFTCSGVFLLLLLFLCLLLWLLLLCVAAAVADFFLHHFRATPLCFSHLVHCNRQFDHKHAPFAQSALDGFLFAANTHSLLRTIVAYQSTTPTTMVTTRKETEGGGADCAGGRRRVRFKMVQTVV